MRHFILLLLAALPVLAHAQTTTPTPGFERLPSGTEYKLYRRDAAGRYAPRPLAALPSPTDTSRAGKFMLMHVTYLTGRDSVLQSTRQLTHGQPVPMPMPAGFRKGSPEEALAMLQPGDSAVFRLRADSLFRGRPVPAELRRGGNVLVLQATAVRLVDQATAMATAQRLQQDVQAEQQRLARARLAAQLPKDNAAIADYLKTNNLAATAKKTAGGTWYIITKRGAGPLPQTGQTVGVRYRGTVLATGKEFDASDKHGGSPFEFALGRGQVIPGWDQGIAMLPKGSKAILLIPSSLAYGTRGAGADIPADANLRFDVELVDIKGAAATPPAKHPATKPAAKTKTGVKAATPHKATKK
ncbi:FKBP-type peptidyl-prolyl cis-trans isomerase [Hymenobacter sp. BRD128]|uniref:FKBP-type peptidyl-prolyl cis-trans isomerase n=1 Tax=Hymenobacter sp. BRD128 TaxID=2675878 RepID=UPI001563C194|nr:FKBP-type peptidyl-prolyl cis-trans isomerase [Hymenobacter sp. BRD128]QKG57285.1 FKBP-type peptidyl-prolyl cis-trans isomerase [Hymenobacter sp. BRD128]